MWLNVRMTFLRWILVLVPLVVTAYGEEWEGTGSHPRETQENDLPDASNSSGITQEALWREPPHIHCTGVGIFPATGSCRDYYSCEDWNGQGLEFYVFWFRCPIGTLFDHEAKQCVSPSTSKHHECNEESLIDGATSTTDESAILGADEYVYEANIGDNTIGDGQLSERIKRSATSSMQCDKSAIESLAKNAREVCANVRHVDTFIINIKSKSPLQLSSFDEEVYKGIISDYNRDLRNAQNNYNEWRHGNSIFKDLKESFQLAKQFEPRFNREFQENQKRVENIANEEQPDIKQMEEDIANLQSEIREVESLLAATQDLPLNQKPLEFLQDRLEDRQNSLKQLIMNDERLKAEKELQELINFLEFVRVTVVEIQGKSRNTAIRIAGFEEKITIDSSIFLRHHETAQTGIRNIQNERTQNQNERAEIENQKQTLQNRINEDNSAIARLRNSIADAERDLDEYNKKFEEARKSARTKQVIGGSLLAFPILGWIAGGILLGVGTDESNDLSREKMEAINEYNSMVDLHHAQINNKNQEIQRATNRISTLNTRYERLGAELTHFNKLDGDLASIQNDINSITPSINKALLSVGQLNDVFDDIKRNLDNIIDVAKSRKQEAEEKNLKYFIYNNISALKCSWDQASVKIVALGECA